MATLSLLVILLIFGMHALSPLFIITLSTLLFKEQLSKMQLLGIVIAATGSLTIIASGILSFEHNTEFALGSLILISTPFLWTAYSLVGKRTMETYHPLTIVAYVTAPGGLFLIPLSLAENSLQKIFTLSLNSWFVILFLSLTCSLLGYYIWFDVVNKAGAALTSTFLFAEPLVTVLLAVIFVREEITLAIIAGGLLIFIGVYLVVKQQNLEKRYSKEKRYRTENRVPSHNE